MRNLMHVNNGAEAFVETLAALGIEHLFINPGIDVVPVQGAVARLKARGRKVPKVILTTHESVAVAAAHGYSMVSGKPQVVVVFQDVGIMQGGGSIINLQYGRSPVILASGRNATTPPLNWMGEPFDQCRITRDYVKWDHQVVPEEDIASVVEEAYRVASQEPCGPIYLSVDRQAYLGKMGELKVEAPIPPWRQEIDPAALRRAVDILAKAENPLILTSYAGRHPEAVAHLVEFAETFAIRVITTDLRMNFPVTHPLCPGIEANRESPFDHYIAETDALFLLDYDYPPPMPKTVRPRPDARIIHVDNELVKKGKRLFDRIPDVEIPGNSAQILPLMNEIARDRVQGTARIAERIDRLAREHKTTRDEREALALRQARDIPISSDWLCYCINRIMEKESLLVHMAPTSSASLGRQLRPVSTGSLYSWGDSAGSMGWPLGAALGAKLAAPERTVISLIGDGGFMYGGPVAALWSARAHRAPFLTILCNNQSYGAIRQLVKSGYGGESVAGDGGFELGVDFPSPPDHAGLVKSCGAYGTRVEHPSRLLPALKRAVAEVRKGRSALVEVKLSPP